MKRILTLIVTLVCVFSAYSQNTVYIWKDNTLSVQAADSIAFYADNVVDLGLSVCWESDDARNGYNIDWDEADAIASVSEGRLPTKKEFEELFSRCSWDMSKDTSIKWGDRPIEFIGPNGNKLCLYVSYYDLSYSCNYYRCWTNERGVYVQACNDSYNKWINTPSFISTSTKKCLTRFVWDN